MANSNLAPFRPARRSRTSASAARRVRKRPVYLWTEFDPFIFFTVIVLVLLGILMIFSASYYNASHDSNVENDMFAFLIKQGRASILGLVGMLAAASYNYRRYVNRITCLSLYILACGLLVYVRLFEEPIKGAYRWINMPIVGSFQPSELAKMAVILMLALYISNDPKRIRTRKGVLTCILIAAIPIGLVFWGKNLSTAIIVGVITFGIAFVASPYVWPFIVMAAGGIGIVITYLALGSGYRSERFSVWLDPFSDPMGVGYQSIQSLFAIASGGLFGLGIGQSNQKLVYMPEPHNDFIFSVICEELGFFGATLVLMLFGLLIYRGVSVALKSPDLLGTLLATGIVVMLGAQVIINVAVVTNTVPNTGVPLPFISYGGTSILFVMTLMGILLNISRYSRKQ